MLDYLAYLILFQAFKEKIANETDKDKKAMHERSLVSIKEAVCAAQEVTSSGGDATSRDAACNKLYEQCRDLLSNWLDDLHGSDVTEKEIFAKLAQKFEAEYHQDMQRLNVRSLICSFRSYIVHVHDRT